MRGMGTVGGRGTVGGMGTVREMGTVGGWLSHVMHAQCPSPRCVASV